MLDRVEPGDNPLFSDQAAVVVRDSQVKVGGEIDLLFVW